MKKRKLKRSHVPVIHQIGVSFKIILQFMVESLQQIPFIGLLSTLTSCPQIHVKTAKISSNPDTKHQPSFIQRSITRENPQKIEICVNHHRNQSTCTSTMEAAVRCEGGKGRAW
jgi:hypothetical protein